MEDSVIIVVNVVVNIVVDTVVNIVVDIVVNVLTPCPSRGHARIAFDIKSHGGE